MTRPKMTTEFIYGRTTPCCPHCGGFMRGVTIPLDSLIDRHPLPKRIEVADDGYGTDEDEDIVVECPDCFRPSALAQDGMNWKLVACRTVKDRYYQEAALSGAVGN